MLHVVAWIIFTGSIFKIFVAHDASLIGKLYVGNNAYFLVSVCIDGLPTLYGIIQYPLNNSRSRCQPPTVRGAAQDFLLRLLVALVSVFLLTLACAVVWSILMQFLR